MRARVGNARLSRGFLRSCVFLGLASGEKEREGPASHPASVRDRPGWNTHVLKIHDTRQYVRYATTKGTRLSYRDYDSRDRLDLQLRLGLELGACGRV